MENKELKEIIIKMMDKLIHDELVDVKNTLIIIDLLKDNNGSEPNLDLLMIKSYLEARFEIIGMTIEGVSISESYYKLRGKFENEIIAGGQK